MSGGGRRRLPLQQHPADPAGEDDRRHLRQRRAPQQQPHRGQQGECGARPVRGQVAGHAQHRVRHHRRRHHLEPPQPALGQQRVERGHPVAEQDHRRRRRQREPEPGRQPAADAGAGHAHRDPYLAAGGAGQELAQRHQVGVGTVVEPAAAGHVLVPEVAEVRHRPAERRQPQLEAPRLGHQRVPQAGDPERADAAPPGCARRPAFHYSASSSALDQLQRSVHVDQSASRILPSQRSLSRVAARMGVSKDHFSRAIGENFTDFIGFESRIPL